MPVIQWQGRDTEAIEVRFKSVREDWNEYDIDDGTTVRIKVIVSDVMRLVDQFDAEGNPVYVVKSGNTMFVKSPDHLKKKS